MGRGLVYVKHRCALKVLGIPDLGASQVLSKDLEVSKYSSRRLWGLECTESAVNYSMWGISA